MAHKKIRVVRLAHIVYQHPDLEKAVSFLIDFGFVVEHRTAKRVYLRGYGVQPFAYVAEKSEDGKRHFAGGFWALESREDLVAAALHANASDIYEDRDAPGGGQFVTIEDPNGFKVGFVYGQKLRDENAAAPSLEKNEPVANGAIEKPRKGKVRRFNYGASPIHKLGHYGFVVPWSKFQPTLKWYQSLMNLKTTDCVFDPKTGEDETVFSHIDLGAEHTDHHSFFLGAGPEGKPAHIHHSSYEVDDFDAQTLGHDWLKSKGWGDHNCWGIGRHVLGSQIFDYWFDPSANIVEHYCDGDVVNEDTPVGREETGPESLYVWGPEMSLGFVTGRLEDAGKQLVAAPDAVDGKPAQFNVLPVVRV